MKTQLKDVIYTKRLRVSTLLTGSETFAKRPFLPNFCVSLNIVHEVKL